MDRRLKLILALSLVVLAAGMLAGWTWDDDGPLALLAQLGW